MSGFGRVKVIAGVVGILALAGTAAVAYRAAAIQGVVTGAEKQALALARDVFDPDRSALATYLTAVSAATDDGTHTTPLPAALGAAMSESMRDANVRSIKIYSRKGVVSASTLPGQVGADQANIPGFKAALNGSVSTYLVSRGTPGRFEEAIDDHTLVETFVPVRQRSGEPVLGVVAIYYDVDAAVTRANLVAIGGLGVAVIIVAVALVFGRRTRTTAGGARPATRDSGALLELLSDRNLRREELARKKLAADLHEGLAQSLSAIKLAVEGAETGRTGTTGSRDALRSVVSDLQTAIQRVREMATGLRPSGLDEFGLIATIRTMCNEFGELYPGIRVERQINGKEALIPAPLKIVIYRNIEAALKIIGEQGIATGVRVSLQISEDALMLAITDNRTIALPDAGYVDLDVNTESPFSPIRERTVISGGQLSMARNSSGAIELRARWHRPQREQRSWKW